ncbi:MAG: helix-turn-helix transcriptional regulator [Clostridia bacterium]|nr:helix-turn-helix transcriptional regulator [Clostridia bacterium]
MIHEKYVSTGLILTHGIDQNPSDRTFSLHVHEDFELLCVVTGKVGYIVEGQLYDLHPGSLMLMRNAETHKLLVNKSEPYERYTLNFNPQLLLDHGFSEELLSAFLDRNLGERNHYAELEFDGIQPLVIFQQMLESCAEFSPESVILSHLSTLLYAVNRVFRRETTPLRHAPLDGNESGRQLLRYINLHLNEELSVGALSREVHLSPAQLNRVFRDLTGTSIYNYILSKRLVAVQERMAKGESALSASQACGFHDYSAFYRLYKKRFGSSPTAQRRIGEKREPK